MENLENLELLKKQETELYKEFLTYILTDKTYTCKCYHLLGTSCNERILHKAVGVFKGLLKINIPIHIIPALMFKIKALSQKYIFLILTHYF